ncbi:MAG: mechanosensitive ion channel family protein [Acidobacteriota bacterium]
MASLARRTALLLLVALGVAPAVGRAQSRAEFENRQAELRVWIDDLATNMRSLQEERGRKAEGARSRMIALADAANLAPVERRPLVAAKSELERRRSGVLDDYLAMPERTLAQVRGLERQYQRALRAPRRVDDDRRRDLEAEASALRVSLIDFKESRVAPYEGPKELQGSATQVLAQERELRREQIQLMELELEEKEVELAWMNGVIAAPVEPETVTMAEVEAQRAARAAEEDAAADATDDAASSSPSTDDAETGNPATTSTITTSAPSPDAEPFSLRGSRKTWIILGVTLLLSLLARWLLPRLTGLTQRTSVRADELIVDALAAPLRLGILVLGLRMALSTVTMPAHWHALADRIAQALVLAALAFLAWRLVDLVRQVISQRVKTSETRLDDQLLPLLARVLKLLIVVGGGIMVLDQLGFEVSSLVAGLGLGGLAFALAAKDTVANLFGSIMIFVDRPFDLGDWVRFKKVEGIVEDVGIRSTKVRTWEDTLFTIPNADLASGCIENVSRFNSRRVSVRLVLRSDTHPELLERAVESVRETLESHEDVKDGHYVFFDQIGENGFELMVYFFVKFTEWRRYLEVRQTIFLDLLHRFEKLGVGLASPTRTVLLEDGRSDDSKS